MSRRLTRFRWCSAAVPGGVRSSCSVEAAARACGGNTPAADCPLPLTNLLDTLYHCIPLNREALPDRPAPFAFNSLAAGIPMNKLSLKWHDARRALSLSKYLVAGAAVLALGQGAFAQDAKIQVVAAENFYGDVVHQLGGDHVDVTSILSNPDEDPHLFEASPKTARALQHANLVVYNGADYDPWMAKLLNASKNNAKRTIIVAADLIGKKSGDNPHLWYNPATMPAVARAVTTR